MWIYILLSAQSLALIVVLYFVVKKLNSIKSPNVVVKNDNIERSVREGMKSAIKELKEEEQQEESLMKSLDRKQQGIGIYSAVPEEKPIKAGDALIPYGLTESEKEILRMFYDQ